MLGQIMHKCMSQCTKIYFNISLITCRYNVYMIKIEHRLLEGTDVDSDGYNSCQIGLCLPLSNKLFTCFCPLLPYICLHFSFQTESLGRHPTTQTDYIQLSL